MIERNAQTEVPDWAYPVNYGKENEVDADVLILGGGIARCREPSEWSIP